MPSKKTEVTHGRGKPPAAEQARRVVAAARELHEAIFAAFVGGPDEPALALAHARLKDLAGAAAHDGREVDGWSGGIGPQIAALRAAIALVEGWLPAPGNPPMRPAVPAPGPPMPSGPRGDGDGPAGVAGEVANPACGPPADRR